MAEIIDKAEEHTFKYAKGKFIDAYTRVERERHGEGCGCPSCMKNAVRDVNSWIDFIGKGECRVKYELNTESGRLKIEDNCT